MRIVDRPVERVAIQEVHGHIDRNNRSVRLGEQLGNRDDRSLWKGGAALTEAVARNADDYARDLAPVLQDIRAEGNVSLRAMPAELNRRGMMTRRGGKWQVSNVLGLVRRESQIGTF